MFRDKLLPLYKNATTEQLKVLGYGVFGHVGKLNKLIYPDEYEEFKKQIQPIEYEGYEKRRVENIVSIMGNVEECTISEVLQEIQTK